MRAHDFALLVEGQMDCISVYMAGVHNVLATSGTAFTEMQVRLLSRFTKRVVVNFDPDQAGANAAEKSIALLAEEDFEVKVVTLEGEGLDPDRYVREHGIQAYMATLRTAKRHGKSSYRPSPATFSGAYCGRQGPGQTQTTCCRPLPSPAGLRSAETRQRRAGTEATASELHAIMRQELKQAAAQRVESVRAHAVDPASETERILLRALVLPERDSARIYAAEQLSTHPEWYDGLPAAGLLEALVNAPAPANPLDAAPDQPSRAMLALALQHADNGSESGSRDMRDQSMTKLVENARLRTLKRRHLEQRPT